MRTSPVTINSFESHVVISHPLGQLEKVCKCGWSSHYGEYKGFYGLTAESCPECKHKFERRRK